MLVWWPLFPPLWKTILRQKIVGDLTPTGIEKLPKNVKLSKFYYWILVKKRFHEENDPCRTMWATELQVEISMSHWKECQLSTFKIKLTIIIKRAKRKAGISNRCTFCRSHPESVMHLLIECIKVAPVLRSLNT